MVDFVWRAGPIRVAARWFHERPRPAGALRFTHYLQCRSGGRHLGFVRRPAHTMILALDRPEEEIFAGFRQRTRNGVRQAERAGVRFELEPDRERFLRFYNSFARRSGLPELLGSHYVGTSAATVLTEATLTGRDLVMHAYIVDAERRRARLTHSARCAPGDAESCKLVGAANRFLHHADMLHFRSRGVRTYDFGGYPVGTTDPKMLGINSFKDGFGGEVIEESSYRSLVLHIVVALRDACRRTKSVVPS